MNKNLTEDWHLSNAQGVVKIVTLTCINNYNTCAY